MVGNILRVQDKEPPVATKDRILDAAEALFMEHGFEATSLRAITAAAGVNLAAVNYHFGSKEELFQAVLTRRLDPMNQERLDVADALRARGRARSRCRLREDPVGDVHSGAEARARSASAAARISCACSGRAYADPGAVHPPFPVRAVRGDDRALQVGVRHARCRSCRRRNLSWRLHFIMGALSYTLAGTDALKLIAELSPRESGNDEMLLRRLAPFLLAGLQSPLPESFAAGRALDGELELLRCSAATAG